MTAPGQNLTVNAARCIGEEVNVILIGNYQQDQQESMLRFAGLLLRELPQAGINAELLCPGAICGRFSTRGGSAKWLAYIDKYVLFPFVLHKRFVAARRLRQSGNTIVHICDHSNAMYTRFLRGTRTVITCHDLLAVRGALGEDTDCPASTFGRFLQRSILDGLTRADFVACDSAATRLDLLRLAGPIMEGRSDVVLLAQNYPYQKMAERMARDLLAAYKPLDLSRPFLLHVGSDLRRKNRDALLRVGAKLASSWDGQIVFAGEGLGEASMMLSESLGLTNRVVEIVKPANAVLEALYSLAVAMIYPSRCEGFGWPVIEAQACGCPVICSDRSSLPEIAGSGAILSAPDDIESIVEAVRSLSDHDVRASIIQHGFRNAERFRVETMIGRYKDLYLGLATSTTRGSDVGRRSAPATNVVVTHSGE